jgi:hypothetical protein
MSKRRVFVSGGRPQLSEVTNRLIDLMLLDKDGKVTIIDAKPYGVAVVPRWLSILATSECGEKPDDAPHLTMPDVGQKLLPFILPKKLRTAVGGDLAEDFRTYAAQWGRPYALRWLWWELGALCIRRFGPTAIITAIGVWFRQKIGW